LSINITLIILQDYDALFHELQEKYPEEPDNPLPPFFLGEPNHSVLTHFNTNQEEEENQEEARSRAARKFVKELARTQKLGEALTKRSYREVEGKIDFFLRVLSFGLG
jgi:hypothetical protein